MGTRLLHSIPVSYRSVVLLLPISEQFRVLIRPQLGAAKLATDNVSFYRGAVKGSAVFCCFGICKGSEKSILIPPPLLICSFLNSRDIKGRFAGGTRKGEAGSLAALL